MPLPLSQMLAARGLTAPTAGAALSPAAMALPAGAVPVDPATVQPPVADVGGDLFGGVTPQNALSLMQAFGGLKAPTTPIVQPELIKAPAPVAPQAANAAAIQNTGPTAAIASLLAAGLRPTVPAPLGQLIMGRR